MPESLDPLLPPGRLYDHRSSGHVPLGLPYHQGDVFTEVDLAGLPEVSNADEHLAMLFMHPCTMRDAGGALREFVTVVRVTRQSATKVLADPVHWERNYKVMPLPDLYETGKGTHAADFMQIATVASAALPRTHRVAQLSADGRLLMQQRIVFHLTRHAPLLRLFEQAVAHIEAEAQYQADWVEAGTARTPVADVNLAQVEALEHEAQEYLGNSRAPDSLRNQLAVESSRAAATRTIQLEIARRYPRPGTL
jgi:hypothetical protein